MLDEPWVAEMQHQMAMDRLAEHFPICSCCGHRIWSHESFYRLNAGKDALTVCEECASEMMDNPCIVEEFDYGGN